MSSVVKSSIDESSKRCESARYVGTKKVRRCVEEDFAEGVCCIANSNFFIFPIDYNGDSVRCRGCADCNFCIFLIEDYFVSVQNTVCLYVSLRILLHIFFIIMKS